MGAHAFLEMVEEMNKFQTPKFDSGIVEIRVIEGEVAIYATADGLEQLAGLCLSLSKDFQDSLTEHIHLEDRGLLTEESLPGVIAIFRE